jgi:lipopolysaccharide export system protein LptA
MWRLFNSATLVPGLLLLAVSAVVTEVAEPAANGRTDITAKKITMRNQEDKAIFEGDVVLKKGTLVVHSDVMVMHFKPQDGAAPAAPPKPPRKGGDELPTVSNRAVSIIEATGKLVQIEKGEGRSTSRKATYYEDGRKIILEGDPVAWQKGTCVSGRRITMFLDDDRTIVEGESRVTLDQVESAQRGGCTKQVAR